MSQIYLAINFGAVEGWRLSSYDTAFEALEAVKSGSEIYGNEWKIVKELEIKIEEESK